MDIVDLLKGQLPEEALEILAGSAGVSRGQAKEVTQMGIPLLMEAMQRNASSPEGARALAGALDRHSKDIPADPRSFLAGVDTADGAKILSHVLGGRKDQAENRLAGRAGLDSGQVDGILSSLAPMLLSLLGQKKSGETREEGLPGLLGSLMEQSGGGDLKKIAAGLLDADGDGDIMDDVGNLLGGFLKR